jgi:hypothetical protein
MGWAALLKAIGICLISVFIEAISATLAEEYILIDKSLSSAVRGERIKPNYII